MTKRLFLAVKIYPSEQFLSVYYKLRAALKHEKIKWVEIENVHITLKFFGETDELRIPAISSKVEDIIQSYSPFDFQLANVGIFGSTYKPRVIWFGIESNQELKNLGLDIIKGMDQIGFEADRQNFVPHLTIGRIKYLEDKAFFQKQIDAFKEVKIQEVSVKELILFESILKRTGPEYLEVRRLKLEG